jgi:hypothetical protein
LDLKTTRLLYYIEDQATPYDESLLEYLFKLKESI